LKQFLRHKDFEEDVDEPFSTRVAGCLFHKDQVSRVLVESVRKMRTANNIHSWLQMILLTVLFLRDCDDGKLQIRPWVNTIVTYHAAETEEKKSEVERLSRLLSLGEMLFALFLSTKQKPDFPYPDGSRQLKSFRAAFGTEPRPKLWLCVRSYRCQKPWKEILELTARRYPDCVRKKKRKASERDERPRKKQKASSSGQDEQEESKEPNLQAAEILTQELPRVVELLRGKNLDCDLLRVLDGTLDAVNLRIVLHNNRLSATLVK